MRARSGSQIHRFGLTLLELLYCLAIAAVIGGIGVPALQTVASNAERTATVNGLLGMIALARSAAQTTGAPITLCKAGAVQACSPAGDRWIVVAEDTTDVLRVLESHYVRLADSNRERFIFRPFPLSSTNGTVSFCDLRGGRAERAIVISTAGRPRVVRPDSQGLAACRRD